MNRALTAFYLNYVTMMGIFIARVSKGRTIREAAIYAMFIMTAGGICIFGINGSFSIYVHMNRTVDVIGLIEVDVIDPHDEVWLRAQGGAGL